MIWGISATQDKLFLPGISPRVRGRMAGMTGIGYNRIIEQV